MIIYDNQWQTMIINWYLTKLVGEGEGRETKVQKDKKTIHGTRKKSTRISTNLDEQIWTIKDEIDKKGSKLSRQKDDE